MKKITFTFLLSICLLLISNNSANAQTLDNSFDTDGKVITTAGGASSAMSVLTQSDGKIVVAGAGIGSNLLYDFTLVRYNSDGSYDNSFGTNGIVYTDFITKMDMAYSMVIQNDGKIVATGAAYDQYQGWKFALARYNTNGTLDQTFGTNGKITTSFLTGTIATCNANSIALQNDGKIVVGGDVSNSSTSTNDFAIARYNTDGSLDKTFDSDGMVTISMGNNAEECHSIAIQNDGKILASGWIDNGSNKDVAIARLNSDGSLDNSFDSDGKLIITVTSGNDYARSMVIQSNNKILLAGSTSSSTASNLFILRLNSDGSFDNTFDTDGKVSTNVGINTIDVMYSLALQNDGKIIAAGVSSTNNNADFLLMRFNTNGSIDNAFGTNGSIVTSIDIHADEIHSVCIQANGDIVAAGSSSDGTNEKIAVARYTFSLTTAIESSVEDELKIYPNPSNNKIDILSSKSYSNSSIRLLSLAGQIVLQQDNLSGNLFGMDISKQENGLYILELNEGGAIKRMKVIKR